MRKGAVLVSKWPELATGSDVDEKGPHPSQDGVEAEIISLLLSRKQFPLPTVIWYRDDPEQNDNTDTD